MVFYPIMLRNQLSCAVVLVKLQEARLFDSISFEGLPEELKKLEETIYGHTVDDVEQMLLPTLALKVGCELSSIVWS